MKATAIPLLAAVALALIQCSPLRDGIVPASPDQTLSPETFSVVLMGDIPYSDRQIGLVEELIRDVNADPDVDLVLHAGDIKGSEPCLDQLYRQRFDLFQGFEKPFIYTIGDNEWADCHRKDNGRYHPLERLDLLRRVFFSDPSRSSGGKPIPLRAQSTVPGFEPFVEHTVFLHKGIVFGTVHVIGRNNGLAPWSGLDPSDTFERPRRDRLEEFRARQAAAVHWLGEIFRVAREADSPGIVVLIQANPHFELEPDDEDRAGFNGFLEALRNLTLSYGRPVLLVHGHKHYLWIDRPLIRTAADGHEEPVLTLTRIQTPGSPTVRWVKLTVDPQSPEVFFLIPPFVFNEDSLPW